MMFSIFPSTTKYLIPSSVLILLVMTVNLTTSNFGYENGNWMMSCVALLILILIVIPHQWAYSTGAFALGMAYYVFMVYKTTGILSFQLFLGCTTSSLYYYISAVTMYGKFKELYKLIFANQKLNQEMKKLLEIFPEGVFIKSYHQNMLDEATMANNQFKKYICNVKDSIETLRRIKVKVTNNEELRQNVESYHTNLYNFLNRQEFEAQDDELHEVKNVQIVCLQNSDNQQSESYDDMIEVTKNFTIKTMKVIWEGDTNAIMHVFIDNTDIIKLEEANNNIKCQKIMFTSASHEFRTPLNAIISSYDFIESLFNKMCDDLTRAKYDYDTTMLIIQTNYQHISKFIKVGGTSSTLLLSLVEDILNLSKMESGMFQINQIDFYMRDLIQEVYDTF